MDIEKVADIFEQFLNSQGKWYAFTEFLEEQGYILSELGFKED